jgi:hypothetical protein
MPSPYSEPRPDNRVFRVIRDGVSIGTGPAREARDHALRGDIIQNVKTFEKFTWWPELGGHNAKKCPYCRMEKDPPKLNWRRK